MGWLVQIQKYSEKGLLTYKSYKFETKEEAERFRATFRLLAIRAGIHVKSSQRLS